MTRHRSERDPAALTAARHLREFGFTGWHLKQRRNSPRPPGAVVDGADRVERQLVQADHQAAEHFPQRDGSAVFLLMGRPRPEAGDGLIALTRYWEIEEVNVMHRDRNDAIYAVYCT